MSSLKNNFLCLFEEIMIEGHWKVHLSIFTIPLFEMPTQLYFQSNMSSGNIAAKVADKLSEPKNRTFRKSSFKIYLPKVLIMENFFLPIKNSVKLYSIG